MYYVLYYIARGLLHFILRIFSADKSFLDGSERALHDVQLAVLTVLVFLIISPTLIGRSLTVVPQSIASRVIEMTRQDALQTKTES